MARSSPGIAILFEHSEWFQPLFAELDRRGIPYDRLLAAELLYYPVHVSLNMHWSLTA